MSETRSMFITALAQHVATSPLSQAEIEAVLSLAAVAAHGTGDRTAAPLACYLAGLAAATSTNRTEALNDLRRRAAVLTGRDEPSQQTN